jgi:hypothetical protein
VPTQSGVKSRQSNPIGGSRLSGQSSWRPWPVSQRPHWTPQSCHAQPNGHSEDAHHEPSFSSKSFSGRHEQISRQHNIPIDCILRQYSIVPDISLDTTTVVTLMHCSINAPRLLAGSGKWVARNEVRNREGSGRKESKGKERVDIVSQDGFSSVIPVGADGYCPP